MRKLDRSDTDSLRKLAGYFVKKVCLLLKTGYSQGDYNVASKIYQSMNDMKSLVHMHVTAGQWSDVGYFFK